MSITLNTTMSSIMTNKRRVGALKSLGVVTVGDALTYYPFRVADPVPLRALREARIGERMAFSASVRGMRVVPMNVRRGYRLEAVVDDGDFAVSRHVAGAAARLVFFSYKKQYVDWLSMRLRSGAIVAIAGEPSEFNGQLQFTHPEIMTVAPGSGPADGEYSGVVQMSALKYDADTVEAGLRRISRPRPVYHASSRISSEHIHESIVQCIELLAGTGQDLPGDAATEAPQTMKTMEDGGISGCRVSVRKRRGRRPGPRDPGRPARIGARIESSAASRGSVPGHPRPAQHRGFQTGHRHDALRGGVRLADGAAPVA